jgi:hypothetical protein
MEGRIDFKLSLLLFSCPTFGIFKIRPMMSLLNTKTLALVTLVTCAAVASPADAQTTLEKKSLGLPGWELHQQGDLFGDPATAEVWVVYADATMKFSIAALLDPTSMWLGSPANRSMVVWRRPRFLSPARRLQHDSF